MKTKLTYTLYLLAKPGDERFFVFTRLPNAAWIEQQRAVGFELLETTVVMPERYSREIDGYAATDTPTPVAENISTQGVSDFKTWLYDFIGTKTALEASGVNTSMKYTGALLNRNVTRPYHYWSEIEEDNYNIMHDFEIHPNDEDILAYDAFPLPLQSTLTKGQYWVGVTGKPGAVGFRVRPKKSLARPQGT